ncbi:pentapeptide repeat-containing protein, partial [Dolichospermum planctonicum UHCC 0167]|nr:pentapeptide repeat-containing protein [Dolichospermum planctonicum UHCC 0167]
MNKILLRYLTLISILAGLCMIMIPQITLAQVNTINYSNANLNNR